MINPSYKTKQATSTKKKSNHFRTDSKTKQATSTKKKSNHFRTDSKRWPLNRGSSDNSILQELFQDCMVPLKTAKAGGLLR